MQRDRLSELPLALIHHVLSFLPFRDGVKTTLLSKLWVNLWKTVPCINIHEEDAEDEEGFKNFVNRALLLWKGTNILKFKIDTFRSPSVHDIRVWTLFAVKNSVAELEIRTPQDYLVTRDLYACSSIRRLSIMNCDIRLQGLPSWNQLTSLSLNLDVGDEDLINRIMLGSPVLEVFDLGLMKHDGNLNIMSTSLKELKIFSSLRFVKEETSLITLSICCPNLETLEIHGLIGKCLFTDVSSLTDATLGFDNAEGDSDRGLLIELLGEVLEQIFSTAQNVENLELSYLCAQAFGASHKEHLLSALPNVMFLKLDVHEHCIEFGDMIDLLRIFPNLKRVKINGLAFAKRPVFNTVKYMELETKISKSFLLQLKIVEINTHSCDSSISGFIEFLLKQAVMLETLLIRTNATLKQHKRFSEKLLSMPRSSPTARVILKND